jgi:predicted PhzF superfamily epimerase YddE/YHI9
MHIRCRGTYQFYYPHTKRTEVTVSYNSSTVMCLYGAAERYLSTRFYCPQTNRTEDAVSYRSSTVMCAYVAAETYLPARFIVPTRTVQMSPSPTVLLL